VVIGYWLLVVGYYFLGDVKQPINHDQ